MIERIAILTLLLLGTVNAVETNSTGSLEPSLVLRYDPFEVPALVDQSAPQTVPLPVQNVPKPWERELRATSVSTVRSIINVDGVILMLGEELDGFRLVEVREGAAVFEKNGTRRTLTMDETELANARDRERD